MSELHDTSCVAHVHSTYSDGTASVPEIVGAARRAGADAVLLTDHDTLGARRDGWEGTHDGVLVLVGLEVSPKGGHYLAFGVEDEVGHAGRNAGDICRAVDEAGGVGFAAHPFSTGSRMLGSRIVPSHAWPALDDGYCAGLELWSVATDTAEGWRTPREAVRSLRAPERAEPPPAHLAAWDQLCAHRRMTAIGGLDAHQPGVRIRGRVRTPMPHERWFSLLRTHLLCDAPLAGDLDRDRGTVLRALRGGRCLLVRPHLGPADGTRFWAQRPDGTTVSMGQEAAAGPAVLNARLPVAAELRVLRDGAVIHRRDDSTALTLAVREPGAYRFEARRDGRLWIISNPVYLREPWPT